MAEIVNRFCRSFLVESVFLMIVGILLILMPGFSTVTLSFLISMSLIAVGIYKLINSIVRRDEVEKFWLQMIIALLLIVAGIYMTMYPFYNLLVLTMGVALYFILDGINYITMSVQSRKIMKYWWMGILSAIVQFILAFIIIYGMPGTALVTVGILLGINLIFGGIAMLSVYASSICRRDY